MIELVFRVVIKEREQLTEGKLFLCAFQSFDCTVDGFDVVRSEVAVSGKRTVIAEVGLDDAIVDLILLLFSEILGKVLLVVVRALDF